MFEYRFATKGLLLANKESKRKYFLNSGNQKLIADYIEWLDSKEQLQPYTFI